MPSHSPQAQLVELFSSIQGEGLWVGERQTFVRFQGCELKCRWCDTPENFNPKSHCQIEQVPFSHQWEKVSNPISIELLNQWLLHFHDDRVSLTGGEPLQQLEFLQAFLPQASQRHRFLLETGGFLPEAFKVIKPWIDTVSLDFKLPSSAKTGTYWKEHQDFLSLAQDCPHIYVKIVVTAETLTSEVQQGIDLINSIDRNILLILQPVSPTRSYPHTVETAKVGQWVDLARQKLNQVRLIPQTHKFLKVS